VASPLPFRASIRDFALVRTRDQWRRCSHDTTEVATGGVVQLASWDEAGKPPATGTPGPGGGLCFDARCRLYHSQTALGRIERLLWAARKPFEAAPQSEPVDILAPAPDPLVGDFGPVAPPRGPLAEPRGLAVDALGHLFVAESAARRVLVFELAGRRLRCAIVLPSGLEPIDLAAAGEVVYCVTAANSLFALTASGPPQPVALPADWKPVRVATRSDGAVALLDRAAGKVHFLAGAADEIALPPLSAMQPGPASATDLEFLDDHTIVVAYLPGDDFFRFPAVTAAEAQAIDVAVGPLRARGYDGLGIVRTPDGHIGFFTERGYREAAPARKKFEREGEVLTFRLDSGAFQTQWGRLFLDACVPDGTSIDVFAASLDEQDPDEKTLDRAPPVNDDAAHPPPHPELSPPMPPERLGPDRVPGGAFYVPLHRRESGRELPWAQPLTDDPFVAYECPLLVAPGRFVWVWLRLRGDGARSPKVRCLRAEHPGHDLLRKLPKVFSRDPAQGDFLRRYLAILEGFLGDADARGAERATLLSPFAAPDELLPWLASFMGLLLDERWPNAKRRLLLSEIANLWRAKGTVCGLTRFLEIYLGVRPVIVEAFRLRGRGGAVLGSDCPPNTTSVLGAGFQVGGDARAASQGPLTPDVVRDAFETRAHRFTVVVPGLLSAEQESVARFILETQRPVHTLYELCTLSNGIRVGKALHVGVSSLVGKSGGFDELQLGAAALGRSAVLGFATPGRQRLGIDRLGVSDRLDGTRIE
jgi:phage tail-like protein